MPAHPDSSGQEIGELDFESLTFFSLSGDDGHPRRGVHDFDAEFGMGIEKFFDFGDFSLEEKPSMEFPPFPQSLVDGLENGGFIGLEDNLSHLIDRKCEGKRHSHRGRSSSSRRWETNFSIEGLPK